MDVGLILNSFGLALGQLSDRRFRRVFFLGIALALALLICFTTGFVWLIDTLTSGDVLGGVRWLHEVITWSAFLVMLVLSMFLMIPVASAITSMFLDTVAEAVEDRHFPHLPRPQPVPFWDSLRDTVNFLGVLLLANVVAIAVYLVANVATPLIFWALNGFLLGREYFTMVAIRWVGRVEAKRLRKRYIGTIWLAGTLMAIPLSVPLLNLVIPILGAATFTHLYHGLTTRPHETSIPRHQR